ncbi:MAG: aromatic amino acid ammonia-lyase [Pseudomonadota bacterium]
MQDINAPPILLDRHITLDDACDVIGGTRAIALSDAARARCGAAFARLRRVIEEKRQVYGITTGFGPLANRLIDPTDTIQLQQNLVNHLATGTGPPLRWDQARAMVLARVLSLVQGASGVRPETIDLLIAVLNAPIAPVIPSRGTVGASGDLTPLAHLVLCLQGRGAVMDKSGRRLTGREALTAIGQDPLDLRHRDALALVNGTSAMTGIAVLNAQAMQRAIDWSISISAVLAECLGARTEAWHAAFSDLRPHAGQVRAAAALRKRVDGSNCVQRASLVETTLDADVSDPGRARAAQDAYSLRCAPQVIGAVWDTVAWHNQVVATELGSVTDNPIFPVDADMPALHGGNFMGTHVALASDAAANAVGVLAGLAERQIARIADEGLNDGLPAFLSGGAVGLNAGFMGAQVTATALLGELRAIGPASVQSISTNAANQDVVSQGTIAARFLDAKLGLLFEILAIAGLAAAQAMDLRLRAGQDGFSSHARQFLKSIRRHSATVEGDRPLATDIQDVAAIMCETEPTRV